MKRHAALLMLTAVWTDRLTAQNSAETIDTPRGVCSVWAMPMGGSSFPRDASIRRCALDQPPTPDRQSVKPPTPLYEGYAGGSIRMVINTDGTVDPDLTRWASISGDQDDLDAMFAHLKTWRLSPGRRGGALVRSAIDLEIRTDRRTSDTLPARVEWRYVAGWERDSLVGHWLPDSARAPLNPRQVDSVHVALLRRLAANHVITVTPNRRYCLASSDSSNGETARLARLARAVRAQIPQLATRDCVDTADQVRIMLPRIYQSENDRVVMQMTGMQLPTWPTGFETRAWDRWTARCVGTVHDRVALRCDVVPIAPFAETSQWSGARRQQRPAARLQRVESEPRHLSVLVTMTGAYGIDTIQSVVRSIPHVNDVARVDSVEALNSWSVWSTQDRDTSAIVVHGKLGVGRLSLTSPSLAKWAPDTLRTSASTALTRREEAVVAFFLDGVGARPTGPLMFCYGACEHRLELQPVRHALSPVARFRVALLRESSRSSHGHIEMRVQLDPMPQGALPIVVFRTPNGVTHTASFMRDLGGGIWEGQLDYQNFDYSKLEGLVYLMRK